MSDSNYRLEEVAQRNGGELSEEAQEALAGAVAGAEELRIEPLDQEGNPI